MNLHKYTFDEILSLCQNHILPHLPQDLNREESVNQEYHKHLKYLHSISNDKEKLLNNILNNSQIISQKNDENGNMEIVLMENAYPYYVDAKHWLMFFGKEEFFDKETAKSFLKQLGINDFIIWENLPGHRSIPQIPHFQILVR